MYYIQPNDRSQVTMANYLDDMIPQEHYVRLIDFLIESVVKRNESLFITKGLAKTGRKPYHPATLLKLYLYGYLNRVNSSRRLETECKRNIEMKWLLGNLVPDHKTISDYRKENGEQINYVVVQFNQMLKQNGYLKIETLSVDGSKIRANASKSVFDKDIEKRIANLEQEIGHYMTELDKNDHAEGMEEDIEQLEKRQEELKVNIEKLEKEIAQLREQKEALSKGNQWKFSLTDPNARVMHSREGNHYAYNIQAAIDKENKLIAALEVSTQPNDQSQLMPMVEAIKKHYQIIPKEILADAGYSNLNDIRKLEQQEKITCYVGLNGNPRLVDNRNQDSSFTYFPEKDMYLCSQGQPLVVTRKNKNNNKRGTTATIYTGTNCPIKNLCTSGKARNVVRFSDQEWRDKHRNKMNSETGKQKLKLRMMLSEHPFGTLKLWMGKLPIKLRGIRKVQTEMNIYHLAYNFKRMVTIESMENLRKMFMKFKWKLA